MSKLRFETVTRIEKMEVLWNKFVPRDVFYHLWEVRYLFYKYFSYPIQAIVGLDGGEAVGFLPLQYSTDKKVLEFFGGYYMEDNQVFLSPRYESCASEFYAQINEPAELGGISEIDEFTKSLPLQDNKFILPLAGLNSVDVFLQTSFENSTLKKMRSHFRRINEENVEVVKNNHEDIELLFDLNIKRFGAESSFCYPHRKEIFRDLLNLPIELHLLKFVINGEPQAVSLSFLFNGVYYRISTGIKIGDFTHIMCYINLKQIEYAISIGSRVIDAALGDYGWKEKWGFKKVPMHILKI